MPEDYIKFIQNIKYYTSIKLHFINPIESKYYSDLKNDKKFGTYPIGKLDDIEIMFLHYSSKEEAFVKWTERCKRINWNKILYKFNDQNGCTKNHLERFDTIELKNKICFTSKKISNLSSCIHIKEASTQDFAYTSQEPFGKSKYININKLINSL